MVPEEQQQGKLQLCKLLCMHSITKMLELGEEIKQHQFLSSLSKCDSVSRVNITLVPFANKNSALQSL